MPKLFHSQRKHALKGYLMFNETKIIIIISKKATNKIQNFSVDYLSIWLHKKFLCFLLNLNPSLRNDNFPELIVPWLKRL
jgi:hypothetical protein